MRVATDNRRLEVDPGDTTSVVVDIVNNGAVIDGVTARIIGLPESSVLAQPALLPLFPDASGQVTLSLSIPSTQPAGHHPLTVEVVSHGAKAPSQFLDVNLNVAARPGMSLAARPRVVRSRRQGRFVLELTNTGNLALQVSLAATDVDRSVQATFAPDSLRIEPGAVAPVLLMVRGPRMLVGAEIDRVVAVAATARRADALFDLPTEPDLAEPLAEPDVEHETSVRLRQRPRLSRGLLTALILLSIVALWAGVFLLGINKVFAGDPMTKAAPPSFFVATPGTGANASGAAAGANGANGAVAGAAPAGALAKNGQLPAGIGGTISGTVIAKNNQKGVGRILVQAYRQTRTGLVVVSSAATQSDGTYSVAGLFPTQYFVKFSATGYPAIWYPGAPAATGARPVTAVAQGGVNGIDAVVVGQPASISGTIDPGETLTPVITTVTARALDGTGAVAARTLSTAAGAYTLTNLAAPGTYEISFTATGYRPTTIVDTVSGGQKRLEPTVQLSVGTGSISGTVTDGVAPLGGATLTTTVGGKPLTVTTPTTGSVGLFVLGNLPTPATYVISVNKDGYGSQTIVVDLTAGQSKTGEAVVLTSGTGSLTGRLTDGDGNGLGGATVTVGGAVSNATTGATPTTMTLTNGDVGSFGVNGLAAPGSYTLTFTLTGYAPATVPITLTDNGAPPRVTVVMSAQLGSITGQITSSSSTFVGATVTVTDGKQVWTTTSTGPGGALPNGGYIVAGLQPGTYTVTITGQGITQVTALVSVVAGQASTQSFTVAG